MRLVLLWLQSGVTMVVLSTLGGTIIEHWFSEMTWHQIGIARLTSALITLPTALPYELFRDWRFVRKGMSRQERSLRRLWVEMQSFVLCQVPLYGLVLSISGTDWERIVLLCTIAALGSVFLGPVCGTALDLTRNWFPITHAWFKRNYRWMVQIAGS